MNKRDFFSFKRPQKSEFRSIGYFLEFSALLTSAIVISGYIYAQIRSVFLGIRGLPIFGVEDYINYGTDPVNFLATALIVLYLLNSFRPEGSTHKLSKFLPMNYLRAFAMVFFTSFVFFLVIGACLIFIYENSVIKYNNALLSAATMAFIVSFYATINEIIDNHLIIKLSSRNFVILSILILGSIGLTRGIIDDKSPRNADDFDFLISGDVKLPEGFKLVLATKSQFVFRDTKGEIRLIKSDVVQAITFKPSRNVHND